MDSADIIEELSGLPGFDRPPSAAACHAEHGKPADSTQEPAAQPYRAALKPAEAAVYDAVGLDETPIDQIILKCGLPTPTVSSTLFALELKKLIKQLPGKHYVRLA